MFVKNILFDYNWDVEKYRTNYDPEYWEICRTFMEVHKTKYPEQRLLHLTEAFYQIGVYGSSYDDKTTRMVSALSVEVMEEFLKKHPGTLRHPFISASVASSEVVDITKDDVTQVIDITQDDTPTTKDVSKSLSRENSSRWDVPVDSSIIVNVVRSHYLSSLFKGLIIIYDVKQNSTMNDDKVSILGESFSRSKFGPLHYDRSDSKNTIYPIKLCLKWKGTVLAEAVGADEEALRIRVAQAILSKLSNLFNGIEAKWMYYRDGQIPDVFHHPNPRRADVYRVLTHSQFKGMVEIISYIDTFANSDSFAEIVFGMDFSSNEKTQVIEYVTKSWSKKLTYRTVSKSGVKSKSYTHVCVYHIHTGEQLKQWLSRSGGDNERYRVVPPKGHRRAGTSDNNIREVLVPSLDETRKHYFKENKTSDENIKKEAEKKRIEEEEKKRKEEEEKKRKEEEEKKRKEEEEKKRKEEEEKKRREKEEKERKAKEERKRKEEEEKRQEEEKKKKLKITNDNIVYPYEENNPTSQKCEEIVEDDLEKLLEGFVLFYDAKKNSKIDKDDWFSALLESFKISKFGPLEVFSENLRPMRMRCAFKWRNKILASAEGLTETQAKTAATLQLISKLEPFTYIIQAKEEYFFDGKVPPFIENPDPSKSHIHRVFRRQDLPSYYSIFQSIDEFVKVPSYGEIIFGNDFTWDLKNEIVVYIQAKQLDYRYFTIGNQEPSTHMAVYHTVNPEDLKNYLLKNGGENEKYKLIPPPNVEPIPSKTAQVEAVKVSEKPDTAPVVIEKVVEKRKQPEKDTSTEEAEGNKIQIKLKKFKLDKVEYPEDTGGDFPGLILWIGIKKNSTWQRSLFCILLESFKMSKYGELIVEEDEEKVWGRKEPLKKCVIKSNRKVLGVGLGESKTEAKNSAALQGLRQLRKYCYTIQAKESYFKEGKSTPYDFEPEPGKYNVYRLAKRNKFKDRASIITFVESYFKTNCHHEVIFGEDFSYDEREAILRHCRHSNFTYRLIKCQSSGKIMHTHVAIYHQKPLPTLKAALMAAGGEDDRFHLIPPGGKISTQNSETSKLQTLETLKEELQKCGWENNDYRLIPPGGHHLVYSDLWPETLDNAGQEASINPLPKVNNHQNAAPLYSEVAASSSQKAPVSIAQTNPPSGSLIPVIQTTERRKPEKNKSQPGPVGSFATNTLNTAGVQNLPVYGIPFDPNLGVIPQIPYYDPQPQFIAPMAVYGSQPHPDMPLSFGAQPQPAVYVPVPAQASQVQAAAAATSVPQGGLVADVVNQKPDLRDKLSKKLNEESPLRKTSETSDMLKEREKIRKDDEDVKGWSRKIFVSDSKESETTDHRIACESPDLRERLTRKEFSRDKIKSPDLRERLPRKEVSRDKIKSPDLRERLTRKEFSRAETLRNSHERNFPGTSRNLQEPNNERIINKKRSSWQNHQDVSPDRNWMRYTVEERCKSPTWQDEKRIVRENEGTSYQWAGDVRDHYLPTQTELRRSHSPIKHLDDRRHYRPESPGIRSRSVWQELAENYSTDIFMYKYVKQDSKTESDPIALLRATKCYKFNIDFDFVTKKVSFNEWRASVELVTDEGAGLNINLLVGEAVSTSVEEAKFMAALHAVDTVQKACRVIEPNFYYFADGGVPEFIKRKSPMKTHIYEIIHNMDPEFPLDSFTIETMLKMFLSSKLEDLFFLATDFSYDERMTAIETADKMGLWWRLFGPRHPDSSPEDIVSTQHVCVYKQKSAFQLFDELLENRGSTEKYLLVEPLTSHIDPQSHIDSDINPVLPLPFGNKKMMEHVQMPVPFGKKKMKVPVPMPVPTVPSGKKKKKKGPGPIVFGKKKKKGVLEPRYTFPK